VSAPAAMRCRVDERPGVASFPRAAAGAPSPTAPDCRPRSRHRRCRVPPRTASPRFSRAAL
jgi:hypothetical protein